MIICYLGFAVLFILLGIVLFIFPDSVKSLIAVLVKRNQLFVIGIVEIGIGLATLYYRHHSRLSVFVFLSGILFFIDGVFYLLSSESLRELHQLILNLETREYRYYSLFLFALGVGYLMAGVITVS